MNSVCVLQNCDLSGCDLQEANLRGSKRKGAIFEDAYATTHVTERQMRGLEEEVAEDDKSYHSSFPTHGYLEEITL